MLVLLGFVLGMLPASDFAIFSLVADIFLKDPDVSLELFGSQYLVELQWQCSICLT